MRWSKYNMLFHSPRFGFFLYNTLSGIFLNLDEPYYRFVSELCHNPLHSDAAIDPDFIALLYEKKILIDENSEKSALMIRHHKRNTICYDTTCLRLTLCPTLACNFRCPYCFETSHEAQKTMDPDTVEQVIRFIKRFPNARRLSISWYGGEPTLSFDTIQTLTSKMKALDINFENAVMATNGYLLDQKKRDLLNELNIKSVQITLDGNEHIHDSRRVLANNRPTFKKIMENIDALMNSSYTGKCSIRVNIDKHNMHEYAAFHEKLRMRFPDRVLIYSGHIDSAIAPSYDQECSLCMDEWSKFTIDLYRNNGIVPVDGFFPDSDMVNSCVANSLNGYVIGPRGELYKCLKDVGKESMVIGSIFRDDPIENAGLFAHYMVGSDPYCDTGCLECPVLPICGGGCANKRLLKRHFHRTDIDFCSHYKNNCIPYLEAYYDTLQTKEVCAAILGLTEGATLRPPYRMIQPERKERVKPHP